MAAEDPTEVTARDPNIEHDVRAMVQRIVDGLFEGDKLPDPTALSPNSRTPRKSPNSTPRTSRRVAIGADHGGFALKERLGFRLKEQGFTIVDCGTDSTDAVDYPDIAYDVATAVASGSAEVGIMVDGAGIGSSMVGNKVPGVRAALCYDLSTARNAREHNHANMLTLGAGLIGDGLAWQITQEFIATPSVRDGTPTASPRSMRLDRPTMDPTMTVPDMLPRPARRAVTSEVLAALAERADILSNPHKLREVVANGADRVCVSTATPRTFPLTSPSTSITRCSSPTPRRTRSTAVRRGLEYGFASVCINPFWVKRQPSVSEARTSRCARSSASPSARTPRDQGDGGRGRFATGPARSTW